MKLCIDCCTLHADDAVLCSECGRNLIKVPAREAAVKPRTTHETDHPEEAGPSATTDRNGSGPLMKLCINCHTLNALDEVFCSECGMSLIKVPTGEEALRLRKAWEADQAEAATRADTTDRNRPGPLAIALGIGWTLFACMIEVLSESELDWQIKVILVGIWLAGVAAVGIWQAAMAWGARLTDWWAGRGRRREARQLGAYMADTHRAGIELSKAELAGADARRASLEGAMLVEANLAEANLQRANLSKARLDGANLRSANLCRANLAGAELSRADLGGACAAEASLEGATLVESDLTGANLRDANLSHANLEGSDLSHANLLRARLRDANLERANLRSANLYNADLQAAVLREANLEEADLRYSNLEGANLEGASLRGADVDDTTAMPQGWEEIVASKPEDEPPSHRADEEGSSVTATQDTALRSVMMLCLNCQTENPADAVLCTSCGVGLTRAPRREEAGPVGIREGDGQGALQIAKFMWGWVLLGVGLAAMVCAAGASLGPVIMLAGTLYSGFGIWMIWSGGRRLGGGDARTRALLWAGGPLVAGASAVAWLGGALLAGVFLGRIGDLVGLGVWPSLVFGGIIGLLLLGGLFVAPLVGAIIVLVEWLQRRSKSSEIRPGSE